MGTDGATDRQWAEAIQTLGEVGQKHLSAAIEAAQAHRTLTVRESRAVRCAAQSRLELDSLAVDDD